MIRVRRVDSAVIGGYRTRGRSGKRIPDSDRIPGNDGDVMTESATTLPTWALRAHAVFEWVWWIAYLNVLWWGFSLAGIIVLGSVPASVAATELTRRRLRGEVFPVAKAFGAAWRREFWRSNASL